MSRKLRIACPKVPTVLDREQPDRLLQPENIDAHLQLYEPLLGYVGASPESAGTDASRAVTNLAAAGWSCSEDRTTYRFDLRSGIRSAHGNELTAADVCWAWERAIALGTVGAWIGGNAGLTEAGQVRQTGTYTVEFRLPFGTTILPHILTVIVPTLFDSTEAERHATPADPWALAWLRDHGAGFGPYVVAEKTDDLLLLVANENYWRGRLPYDQVEFRGLADIGERRRAIVAGDCEVGLGLDQAPENLQDVTALSLPTSWRTMLGISYQRAPFNDPRFRRGLALAVPYHRIVAEGYLGQAKAMTSCISDIVIGHSPQFDLKYAPDEARELLSDFLPLPPVRLTYHSESFAFPRIAAILAETFEAVGLEIQLELVDAGQLGLMKLRRELELFIDEDGPITIDGRYALGHDVNPPLGEVFDFTGYHSDKTDKLLRLSLRELDDGRMLRMLAEVQAISARDLPWIPLAQQKYVLWLHNSVSGYRWYPLPRPRVRDLVPVAHAVRGTDERT